MDHPIVRLGSRAADYMSLLKPELTGLSVFTALFGTFMARSGQVDPRTFMVVLAGTLMVGGGAGAINQYIERDRDALMKRTERRPLPSGRLLAAEALILGSILSVTGIALLFTAGNILSGTLALATSVLYIFVYTPLKPRSPSATFIGAVPGALPPVIGWTVVTDDIGPGAVILFLILFAWQMPHFYSLAWLYRKDYARAGFAILTVLDPTGRRTSARMLFYSAMLLSLAPLIRLTGTGGWFSVAVAVALSAGMLALSWRFYSALRSPGADTEGKTLNGLARRIFFASLIYLPLLIIGIVIDTF